MLLTSQARLGSSAQFIKARFEPQIARARSVQNFGWLGKARARYAPAWGFKSQKQAGNEPQIMLKVALKLDNFQYELQKSWRLHDFKSQIRAKAFFTKVEENIDVKSVVFLWEKYFMCLGFRLGVR